MNTFPQDILYIICGAIRYYYTTETLIRYVRTDTLFTAFL